MAIDDPRPGAAIGNLFTCALAYSMVFLALTACGGGDVGRPAEDGLTKRAEIEDGRGGKAALSITNYGDKLRFQVTPISDAFHIDLFWLAVFQDGHSTSLARVRSLEVFDASGRPVDQVLRLLKSQGSSEFEYIPGSTSPSQRRFVTVVDFDFRKPFAVVWEAGRQRAATIEFGAGELAKLPTPDPAATPHFESGSYVVRIKDENGNYATLTATPYRDFIVLSIKAGGGGFSWNPNNLRTVQMSYYEESPRQISPGRLRPLAADEVYEERFSSASYGEFDLIYRAKGARPLVLSFSSNVLSRAPAKAPAANPTPGAPAILPTATPVPKPIPGSEQARMFFRAADKWYLVKGDGSGVRQIPGQVVAPNGKWSAELKASSPAEPGGLYFYDLVDGGARRLASLGEILVESPETSRSGCAADPPSRGIRLEGWSEDSQAVVLSTSCYVVTGPRDRYVMYSSDGTRRVVEQTERGAGCLLSPTGWRFCSESPTLLVRRDPESPTGYSLYLRSPEGGETKLAANVNDPNRAARTEAVLSPDGSQAAFSTREAVWTVNIDGTGLAKSVALTGPEKWRASDGYAWRPSASGFQVQVTTGLFRYLDTDRRWRLHVFLSPSRERIEGGRRYHPSDLVLVSWDGREQFVVTTNDEMQFAFFAQE